MGLYTAQNGSSALRSSVETVAARATEEEVQNQLSEEARAFREDAFRILNGTNFSQEFISSLALPFSTNDEIPLEARNTSKELSERNNDPRRPNDLERAQQGNSNQEYFAQLRPLQGWSLWVTIISYVQFQILAS